MSYAASAFDVMVASPGDVDVHRAIVRDEVYAWNAIHSRQRGIVLLPTGWETHSSPEMGERPQGIINRQLLDKCDLLVAIFGARLGTDTGKYESGTVEEIEEHMKRGQPVMVYFSTTIGDTSNFNVEQFQRLQAFQERCRQVGLYETFGSDSEFRLKFGRQLQLKVNDHPMFRNVGNHRADGLVTPSSRRTEEKAGSRPTLSEKAMVLLKLAALDPSGYIMVVTTMEGDSFQVNNEIVNKNFERRELSLWEDGVNLLAKLGLIRRRPTAGKGLSLYEMTSSGYTVADMIDADTKQWK
jgi:hypothetical protein